MNLRAPEAVRSGESLTLSCTYVLEREKLYSVKFYLGDIEFYRFVPRESPPTRVFRPNGVSIKVRGPFGCYFPPITDSNDSGKHEVGLLDGVNDVLVSKRILCFLWFDIFVSKGWAL